LEKEEGGVVGGYATAEECCPICQNSH